MENDPVKVAIATVAWFSGGWVFALAEAWKGATAHAKDDWLAREKGQSARLRSKRDD